MHRLPVKSKLVDSSSENTKLEIGGNTKPVCPKPRRLETNRPEFLMPLISCNKHSQSNSNEKSEILNIISSKGIESREGICIGCLPCCYSGSPPSRTENPVVHDVQFLHQMELLSPFARTNLSDKFGLTSAISN